MTRTHDSDEYPMDTPLVPAEGDPGFADELLIGELTAALAAEAASEADELPPELAKLATQGGEAIVRAQRVEGAGSVAASAAGRADGPAAGSAAAQPSREARPTPVTPLRTATVWSGWLAAAAMLAFMVVGGGANVGGNAAPEAPQVSPQVSPEVVAFADPSAVAAELQDSLVANDAALRRGTFAGTDDPAGLGASGEVLWSGDAQRGVMRLVGLQPNDRARLQYQLWIFDKARDQRYPVDGGVFDVPAGVTEVLVPIDARVPVSEAAMFAVTVEPAGGVVVSTRERVALLAEL